LLAAMILFLRIVSRSRSASAVAAAAPPANF